MANPARPRPPSPARSRQPTLAPNRKTPSAAENLARKVATAAATAAAAKKLVSPADAAMAWLHGARFLTTASQLDQLPSGELPEIAFVGRSNAGKSTAINTLAQQRQLAFASRTPGRTQHINLFEVGPREQAQVLLADLPGYGYAAVERSAKLRWQTVMAEYLELRRPLHGLVLMIDSRHGFTELDQRLLALVAPRVLTGEVRLMVLLTKADKLSRSEAAASLQAAQLQLQAVASDAADISVTLFSALNRQGVGDAAETLHGWCALPLPRAASSSPTPPTPTELFPPVPAP